MRSNSQAGREGPVGTVLLVKNNAGATVGGWDEHMSNGESGTQSSRPDDPGRILRPAAETRDVRPIVDISIVFAVDEEG